MADLSYIVTSFVAIVRDQRLSLGPLAPSEIGVLKSLLIEAGFKIKEVVPGEITYPERDGYNESTGKMLVMNHHLPYKALNKEGEDDWRASEWLDRLFWTVESRKREEREKIVDFVNEVVEKSQPLEPICLSPYGDYLLEYPRQDVFGQHGRDTDKLTSCVGVHDYCRGWVDRARTSEKFDVLHCRNCHLRVVIPHEITTYGELRQFLTGDLASVLT